MARDPSLIIRNGTVVDGTGAKPFEADVAIEGGKIVAVERKIAARGAEEIDAKGQMVAPGLVDIHTHYDGQVTWSGEVTPSSQLGVTTVLMGNCGVGFAPVRKTDHGMLIRLMEGVEDIPEPVLSAGLPWNWESFGDYLDALDARHYDADIATQLPHAALRVYVMGERGVDREPATAADSAEMRRLSAEAMRQGALGFGTSRTINHKASDGRHIPTLTAEESELTAIAMGMKDAGRGVMQIVSDLRDVEGEFAMLRRIVEASGRPLSISLAQNDRAPERWRQTLGLIERASDEGLPMKAQVCGRAIGLMLGLELTRNPFFTHPTYKKIAHLPLKQRVAEMRKPEVRAAILSEEPMNHRDVLERIANFERIFVLGDPPDYEQAPEQSLAGIARRTGKRAEEIAYDVLLERDGSGMLYVPLLNYVSGNLDTTREMLTHRDTLPGLGDGGAHVGIICDASTPTFLLTHWARDRKRGAKLPIETVISRQARQTAAAVGLNDRGVIAPGYKADINVIDFDRLMLRAPEVAYDLPTGGRRLMQRAEGYVATIVSGAVVRREGVDTGARPGRLVRGAQRRRVTYAHITVEHDGAVAVLTFNRPAVLNAFNNELMQETLKAVAALNADDSTRVIVVRGTGRAFSAGFDLKASAERPMEDVSDWERQMKLQFDFIMQFWHSPKPTIAVAHGFCLAGAFELMLACDVTVAAEGTRFGEPEVRFGTGIVAMLLPWITGPKQAKELLLTGDDRIDAADALRMGIVNHVVPVDQAFDKGMAIARTMAKASERSVRMTKRAINAQYEAMGLSGALSTALDMDVLLNAGSSPEKREFARIRKEQGVKAALAWRDARFK